MTTFSHSSRRQFLATLAAAPLLTRTAFAFGSQARTTDGRGPVHLIAHRGGVVDDRHPENSPSSLEAAIERGYWMLEVDIRRSRDGRALLQHDANFQRFYGDPRKVDEMTWAEIAQLRATPAGNRPMTFDELCERCTGRIRLMLDIKGNDFPDDFYQGLIDSLRKHRMLESTFCLSADRVHALSGGVARRAMNSKALAEAISRGEPVTKANYLFELGAALEEPALELCRKHDIIAVAALNTFRYVQRRVDPMEGARADVQRLRALGVQYFQMDSVFDRFLLG